MWVSRLQHTVHLRRRVCVFTFLHFGRRVRPREESRASCITKVCASSFAGVEISNQIANFVLLAESLRPRIHRERVCLSLLRKVHMHMLDAEAALAAYYVR